MSDALIKARDEKKNVFLFFTAKWCGPCKVMEKTTLSNDTVLTTLQATYISIKADIDSWSGGKLAQEFMVSTVPTLVILDSDRKLIRKHVGRLTANEFLDFIELEKVVELKQPAAARRVKSVNQLTTEVGIAAGINRSVITDLTTRGRAGYETGVFASLEFNRWLLRPGIYFTSRGGKIDNQVIRLNYIEFVTDVGFTIHKGSVMGFPGGIRIVTSPYASRLVNQDGFRQQDYGIRWGAGAYIGQTSNLELLLRTDNGLQQIQRNDNGSYRNQSVTMSMLLTF